MQNDGKFAHENIALIKSDTVHRHFCPIPIYLSIMMFAPYVDLKRLSD